MAPLSDATTEKRAASVRDLPGTPSPARLSWAEPGARAAPGSPARPARSRCVDTLREFLRQHDAPDPRLGYRSLWRPQHDWHHPDPVADTRPGSTPLCRPAEEPGTMAAVAHRQHRHTAAPAPTAAELHRPHAGRRRSLDRVHAQHATGSSGRTAQAVSLYRVALGHQRAVQRGGFGCLHRTPAASAAVPQHAGERRKGGGRRPSGRCARHAAAHRAVRWHLHRGSYHRERSRKCCYCRPYRSACESAAHRPINQLRSRQHLSAHCQRQEHVAVRHVRRSPASAAFFACCYAADPGRNSSGTQRFHLKDSVATVQGRIRLPAPAPWFARAAGSEWRSAIAADGAIAPNWALAHVSARH